MPNLESQESQVSSYKAREFSTKRLLHKVLVPARHERLFLIRDKALVSTDFESVPAFCESRRPCPAYVPTYLLQQHNSARAYVTVSLDPASKQFVHRGRNS